VLDASGHFPTGILSGNVNSFGDFQECLSVVNSEAINGKHCYVEMHPFVNKSTAPYVDYLREHVQSFEIIKSRLEDVSEIFPKLLLKVMTHFLFSLRISSADFRRSFMEFAYHQAAQLKM
jgi:hypothetical protein